jgi:isopenicillin N synthase-like dioxygenase
MDETAYRWQRARLERGRLVFDAPDGMARALRDGFFFVRRPPGAPTAPGDRFAEGFYLPEPPGAPDPFRGFRRWTTDNVGPRQGYFSRTEDQTEQFFLESRHWDAVFPSALADQARAMRDFALGVLRAVLGELDLPPRLWDEATGGCLSLRGTYHLTFNHFRPEIRARGLNIHKDSGWVTVLRSVEPGLEVERDGAWCPIAPEPDTFIVNFGCAMEILTRESATPVSAVAHRVVEQPRRAGPDRFSYALFVDSSLDTEVCPGLFSYRADSGLTLVGGFDEFLTEIVQKTYERETTGLY